MLDTATPIAEQVSPIYAGAILGGSLHRHRHQSSLAHFAKANAAWLNVIPVAFFSVSLSIAGDDADARAEVKRLAGEFLDVAGLHAETVELIAGALKYTRYDFFKRWVMRLIAARAGGDTDISCDHEYTDWHGVRRFADECAAAMQSVHGEPVNPGPGADAFPGVQRDEGARVVPLPMRRSRDRCAERRCIVRHSPCPSSSRSRPC
jgi:menaquinone-dependent protoporphyrinogen oxidase